MAKKQSKPVVKSVNIYNRDRAMEISEGKFTCTIVGCEIALKFRMLRPHVTKEHKSKVALVCHLLGRDGGSCDWICGKSMRCLASHRKNRDIHNFVAFHGKGLNLDGRAKVIVASSPSPQYTELAGRKNHTSECVKATDALVKYTARTKKREARANAKPRGRPRINLNLLL